MPRNKSMPFMLKEPDEDLEAVWLMSVSSPPDEQGHYKTYRLTGLKDRNEARLTVQRLHRPRQRRKFQAKDKYGKWKAQYGLHAEIIAETDGTYTVSFYSTTREAALRHMLEKYGEDRTKWPYSTNKDDPNYPKD